MAPKYQVGSFAWPNPGNFENRGTLNLGSQFFEPEAVDRLDILQLSDGLRLLLNHPVDLTNLLLVGIDAHQQGFLGAAGLAVTLRLVAWFDLAIKAFSNGAV